MIKLGQYKAKKGDFICYTFSGDEITEESINELDSLDSILTVDLHGDKYTFTNKTKYWERAIWFVVGKKFLEGDGHAIVKLKIIHNLKLNI